MMKSIFKDTYPKRHSEVPKVSLKKVFLHSNILITIHFHSYDNKRPFDPPQR